MRRANSILILTLTGAASSGACARPPATLPCPVDPAEPLAAATPEAAATPATAHAETTPAKAAPAPALAREYQLVWTRPPKGGWAGATVITPSGDVASVSRDQLTIHARHDGSELESGPQCDPVGPRAMTVTAGKLYLACSDEIREVTLPGLRYRVVQRGILAGQSPLFREAAFGGDKVVYAHNDGAVEVYSTTTWQRIDQIQLPKTTFSPAIAVSADGARFTVSDGDTDLVQLFERSGQRTFGDLEEVLAFNPAGTHVFGSPGSFRSAEAALTGGQIRELAKAGSWLTAAIYFGDGELAIAGSDGVRVLGLETGYEQALSEMTAETLAVSPDGRLICAADRGDELSCFGRGTIEASTYAAATPSDMRLGPHSSTGTFEVRMTCGPSRLSTPPDTSRTSM